MQLHNLKATEGARKAKHRVGRGHAAGKGKQAGKGQSGQAKRSGTKKGFEGGQTPWHRRLPKRGFKNVNHIQYQIINLSDLEQRFAKGALVDLEALNKEFLLKRNLPVKLLAKGKLSKNLTVKVHAVSEAANKAVEAAGGKVEVL